MRKTIGLLVVICSLIICPSVVWSDTNFKLHLHYMMINGSESARFAGMSQFMELHIKVDPQMHFIAGFGAGSFMDPREHSYREINYRYEAGVYFPTDTIIKKTGFGACAILATNNLMGEQKFTRHWGLKLFAVFPITSRVNIVPVVEIWPDKKLAVDVISPGIGLELVF